MATPLVRPAHGAGSAAALQRPAVLRKLKDVRDYLIANHAKVLGEPAPTVEQLAKCISSVVQVQEETCGKGSQTTLTRVPAKMLHDYSPGGSLCVILATAFQYGIDKLKPGSAHPDLIAQMNTALEASGHLARPRVFFASSFPSSQLIRLKEIARRYQCDILTTIHHASHVITRAAQSIVEDKEDYYRAIEKEGDELLLHWWYTPDSYDNWIPLEMGRSLVVEQPPSKLVWKVNHRWLLDLAEYHEYMNEEDYEDVVTDIPGLEAVIAQRRMGALSGAKRRHEDDEGESNGFSREKLEDPAIEAALAGKEAPQNPTVVNKVDLNEELKKDNVKENDFKPSRSGVFQKFGLRDLEEEDALPPLPAAQDGSVQLIEEQQYHIIVPSTAAWFDYDKVHEIEMRALPEFFNGKNSSKAPEVYKAYRNFMIDTYRLNPSEYLSATACRRNLAGDACSIFRVHAFLEHWGLINYQVDQSLRPTPMGPPPSAHFHMLAETQDGLVPFQAEEEKPAKERVLQCKPYEPPSAAARYGLRTDPYVKGGNRGLGFADVPTEWTDQEILTLLEGIELHKDHWGHVADHVNKVQHNGNNVRSHDDCILAFIKLPIEEPYLFHEESVTGSATELPFALSKNPLLTTLNFLASKVDSSVAAEGAKAALKSLSASKQKRKADADAAEANGDVKQDQSGMDVDKKAGEAGAAPTEEEIRAASEALLTDAAEKARALALAEERKMQALTAKIVQHQLRKLEIKMRKLEELEMLMAREREETARQRQHLLQERLLLHQKRMQLEQVYGHHLQPLTPDQQKQLEELQRKQQHLQQQIQISNQQRQQQQLQLLLQARANTQS
eukprot:m.49313 g.49313  ORF g.49313 m.49313 type:complete len:841 (+) comp15033_c0_seq1:114-2636(+)